MIHEIEHITITTGAARLSARSEVGDEAVDRVRAGISTGGAVGGGWSIRLIAAPEGLALYDLMHEGARVVTCLLCIDPLLSARAWIDASRAAPAGVRLHEPVTIPWLAVIIADTGSIADDPTLFADILGEAGDLGRVVAWALIE